MTTTLASPLGEIADELTASGYSVHDPGCLKIINARGAICDLTMTASGLLTWEYRSSEGSHIDPAQLTSMVTAILDHPGIASAHRSSGATITSAIAKAVALDGLRVRLDVLDEDTALYETYSELTIINPAKPDRGTVRVTDDGALYWHSNLDDGLTHAEVASSITRALAAAGHIPSDLP